jgi:hypothetical protein
MENRWSTASLQGGAVKPFERPLGNGRPCGHDLMSGCSSMRCAIRRGGRGQFAFGRSTIDCGEQHLACEPASLWLGAHPKIGHSEQVVEHSAVIPGPGWEASSLCCGCLEVVLRR